MRRRLSIIREQEYQDKFCISYGLPVVRQRANGIDYYDEACGWLEFVLDGKLETKDISKYPQVVQLELDTRYSIIFLRKPPSVCDIKTMARLGVSWFFWAILEDTDAETFIKNDKLLMTSNVVEKSALIQPLSIQQDTE